MVDFLVEGIVIKKVTVDKDMGLDIETAPCDSLP